MAAIHNDLPTIRRIVTSLDQAGKGFVKTDGPVRITSAGDSAGASFGVAWQTNTSPADSQAEGDGAELPSGELTNPEGSVLRYVDIPPKAISPMHRTDSLDYGILLSGEISLVLDDGSSTAMKVGDVCVQRSTNHAWKNTSDTKWARMVYVLLAAKPVVIGGKILPPVSLHP